MAKGESSAVKMRYHVKGFLLGPDKEKIQISGHIRAYSPKQARHLAKRFLAKKKNLPIECFTWLRGVKVKPTHEDTTLPLFPE